MFWQLFVIKLHQPEIRGLWKPFFYFGALETKRVIIVWENNLQINQRWKETNAIIVSTYTKSVHFTSYINYILSAHTHQPTFLKRNNSSSVRTCVSSAVASVTVLTYSFRFLRIILWLALFMGGMNKSIGRVSFDLTQCFSLKWLHCM